MLDRDYSNAPSNFYDNNGIIKKPPEHLPRHVYSLDYHLKKLKSEPLKVGIRDFIGVCNRTKGLTVQISKKKVSVMRRFIFLYLEVRRNFINLHLKGEKDWKIVKIHERNVNFLKSVASEIKIIAKSGENTYLKGIVIKKAK